MPDGDVPLANNFLPLIIALVVLVMFSAFTSMTETAFSCASKLKLRSLAYNGNKRAKRVLTLAEEKYDKLISTILIGNNLVNITSATLATMLFAMLIKNEATANTVSTIATTVVVLIFGEITPKLVAKIYPEKIAM